MIQLQLYGDPVPWSAPRVCKTHTYNSKHAEKEKARWQIKAQYREPMLTCAVFIDFLFFVPIPARTSKIRQLQMLNAKILPMVKPDTTNLQKFYEDCLSGIVIEDDKNVTDIAARKRYGSQPGVLIRIYPNSTHQEFFRHESPA